MTMELIFFTTENCYKTRRIDLCTLDSSVSLLNHSLESIIGKRKEVSIYRGQLILETLIFFRNYQTKYL